MHQSKGIAKTKKMVYQDLRNLNWFGRKSDESVKVNILKIEAVGDKF